MFEEMCPGAFSIEHFCNIFDNSFIGCIVIDVETDEFIGVNQAVCTMFGVSVSEFLAKKPIIEDSNLADGWQAIVDTVLPKAKKYGHSAPVEFRYVIKVTGEVMYLKVQCFMIESVILETCLYVLLVVDNTIRKKLSRNDETEDLMPMNVDVDAMVEAQLQKLLFESNLTLMEVKICIQLRKFKTTKTIADEFGISVATVNTHRRNIRAKLGLQKHRQNLYQYLIRL